MHKIKVIVIQYNADCHSENILINLEKRTIEAGLDLELTVDKYSELEIKLNNTERMSIDTFCEKVEKGEVGIDDVSVASMRINNFITITVSDVEKLVVSTEVKE